MGGRGKGSAALIANRFTALFFSELNVDTRLRRLPELILPLMLLLKLRRRLDTVKLEVGVVSSPFVQ